MIEAIAMRTFLIRFMGVLLPLSILAWAQPLHGNPPSVIPEGYSVETIYIPDEIVLEVGGLAFADNGDLFICTRYGEVWVYRHEGTPRWRRFADGLHEPLGIRVEDERTVYVIQKPELTQLVDETGDGVADFYRNINHDWGLSDFYHEYAFGLPRDADGNFYLTLNGDIGPPGARVTPDRGIAAKVTPDGELVRLANGLRAPAGVTLDPDGELWVTDNEGRFVPTSCLYHVRKGRFFGHLNSLFDDPRFEGRDPTEVPVSELEAIRTFPAVWFPHGIIASSPGEVVVDTTDGAFGPFAGQMFMGDQNLANVSRISLEKVGGEYQGVVFDFINHLQSGMIRSQFAPDGSLWVGQVARGWGSRGDRLFGLQRIVYDGETPPFAIETIRVTPGGFKLVFTRELDQERAADPGLYEIEHWRYDYPHKRTPVDHTGVEPVSVRITDDRRSAVIELPDLVRHRVYRITAGVVAEDGAELVNDSGYYTLNRIPAAD